MAGKFTELAKAKIKKNRNIVISETTDGTIALAQQLLVDEDGRKMAIFIKGAIMIEPESLFEVRDALNEAIEKLEKIGKIS